MNTKTILILVAIVAIGAGLYLFVFRRKPVASSSGGKLEGMGTTAAALPRAGGSGSPSWTSIFKSAVGTAGKDALAVGLKSLGGGIAGAMRAG